MPHRDWLDIKRRFVTGEIAGTRLLEGAALEKELARRAIQHHGGWGVAVDDDVVCKPDVFAIDEEARARLEEIRALHGIGSGGSGGGGGGGSGGGSKNSVSTGPTVDDTLVAAVDFEHYRLGLGDFTDPNGPLDPAGLYSPSASRVMSPTTSPALKSRSLLLSPKSAGGNDGQESTPDMVKALAAAQENPVGLAIAAVLDTMSKEKDAIPPPKPTLPPVPVSVVVGGPPRGGKSDIAGKLARQYLLSHITPEGVTEAAVRLYRGTVPEPEAAAAVWAVVYDPVTAPVPAPLSVEDAGAMSSDDMLYHRTMFEAGARAHAMLVVRGGEAAGAWGSGGDGVCKCYVRWWVCCAGVRVLVYVCWCTCAGVRVRVLVYVC